MRKSGFYWFDVLVPLVIVFGLVLFSGCQASFGECDASCVDDSSPCDGDADGDVDGDADIDGDTDSDGDSDGDTDVDADNDDGGCVPRCDGRDCGWNGCDDGTCGSCGDNQVCDGATGRCECPFVACGDTCCSNGQVCHEEVCCSPNCVGRECSDGCGGTCGLGCAENEICGDGGLCNCENEICDRSCCAVDEVCHAISDVCCLPDCDGRNCGPDGCGRVCETSCLDGTEVCRGSSPDEARCGLPTGESWVVITADTFVMGSPTCEVGRQGDEIQRIVTLTHSFAIFSTEITQSEFLTLMEYSPSRFAECGDNCPVEMVNWHEAAAYCNALSDEAGLTEEQWCYDCTGSREDVECEPRVDYPTPYNCPGYRLPTEAEWEYAARAGTTTATYAGNLDVAPEGCDPSEVLDPNAWWCRNSLGLTHEVSILDPNPFGLFDVLGNVWEWCSDWHRPYPAGSIADPIGPTEGSARVRRGASYDGDATDTRAANRSSMDPDVGDHNVGFRPVRTLGL